MTARLLPALCALLLSACAAVDVRPVGAPVPVADAQIDRAEEALRAGDSAAALALLGEQRDAVAAMQQERWARLRAQALAAEGEDFEAARTLALLDPALPRSRQGENRGEIERLLARVPDHELAANAEMLPDGHVMYPFVGRALSSRGMPLPRAYDRAASERELLALRPAADADGYRPPMRVGVLLPMSGPMAVAGQAVRDGMLSAHYNESRRRPDLVFYDTAGTPQGSLDAYQLASTDGVDQVLGPLAREEVGALFELDALQIPVLALNRAAHPGPPGSGSFALLPEEEGIAAAERLLARGYRRIIAVAGDDDSARRALHAFRVRFQQRGGELAAEARIDDRSPDYGPVLSAALAAAGGPATHDAVFLAMRAPQARLLVPQLAVAGFPPRPIAATSQILIGGDARQDRELDGIEFPESPWLLGRFGALPDVATLGRQLDSVGRGGARLFAFGFDAYTLLGYLEHLAASPRAWINGATGELRIDGFGNVLRSPAWGVFSGGRPRPAFDGGLTPETIGGDGGRRD